MPPSQLKQLKASLQVPKGQKRKRAPPTNKETHVDRSQRLRAHTLLPELQRRHKVGGILDRRIGENDPRMAPEDRALQRFTREASRRKKESVFNLEEDDDVADQIELTHGGRSLDLLEPAMVGRDDFDESGLGISDDEIEGDTARKEPLLKRVRLEDGEGGDGDVSEGPVVKKTHTEIMQEVMAKSKMYKQARQEQKEDDDNIREELDKGLGDLMAALRGKPAPPPKTDTSIHPDRLAQLNGTPRPDASKEYDKRLRQLALDKRAQPTERTKTEEEQALQEANRLKELENKRLRRMRGEEVSDEEDERRGRKKEKDGDDEDRDNEEDEEDKDVDEAAAFGIEAPAPKTVQTFDVEDEDDFIIEDDLVASGSDVGELSGSDEDESEKGEDQGDDEDFLQDILLGASKQGILNIKPSDSKQQIKTTPLAYTYPCPETHEELLNVVKGVPSMELPTVVQRIRALYHPQLHASNKAKLTNFAVALVDHISYIVTLKPPLVVVESLIRHIHSMSKTFPDEVAVSFRSHLQQMHDEGTFDPGDLVILTTICAIYPTSDHFHQVVTPAMTIMARWLGTTNPTRSSEQLTGAYLVALIIKYQRLSKRYVPETIRFTAAALKSHPKPSETTAHVTNLSSLMELWSDLSAFTEIFSPGILLILRSLASNPSVTCARPTLQKLQILLSQAHLRRRPLILHNHRPLPIKTSAPKFEETFNPNKHYDVDRERAEASKLRAEYRREKKGALRELKKDSGFLHREKLSAKKTADRAYEAKQRRLIAEIQGGEGAEKNKYERDKARRKGKF